MRSNKRLILASSVFLIVLLLAACGNSAGTTPISTAEAPTPTATVSSTAALPTPEIQPTSTPVERVVEEPSSDSAAADPRRRVVVAATEGTAINIYSFNFDGSDKRLLVSEDIGYTADPFSSLWPVWLFSGKISDNGELIAYKLTSPDDQYAPGSLFVMDSNGENKRKIFDEIRWFYPSPDGKKILYSELKPPSDPGSGGSPPNRSQGRNWRMFEVATGRDWLVVGDDTLDHGFNSFQSWIDDETAIFISYFQDDPELFWVRLNGGPAKQIDVPKINRNLGSTDETNTSANSGRTALLISHSQDSNPTCDIYDLTTDGILGERILNDDQFACKNVAWNNDQELYYVKETNPVELIPGENELRIPIVDSVFKFDLETGKNQPVILGDRSTTYSFMSLLPNRALFVVNESIKRSPRFIQEIRDLDGTNPVTLLTGDWHERPVFVGWSR